MRIAYESDNSCADGDPYPVPYPYPIRDQPPSYPWQQTLALPSATERPATSAAYNQ